MSSRPERVACSRMNNVCKRLCDLSRSPSRDSEDYDAWLEQADLVEFLEKNAEEEKTVVYASGSTFYASGWSTLLVLSVLVPQADIDPPDVKDLLGWSCVIPETAWSVCQSGSKTFIEPWGSHNDGKSLRKAGPLVFMRGFDGVPGYESYVEILQKFSHVFGLHYMEERKAWCRLDGRGDIENVVEVVDFSSDDFGSGNDKGGGRAVLFDRGSLEEYAAMTGTVLVRMFDCDRHLTREIHEYESGEIRSPETGIFYRCGVAKDPDASYTRGVQIVPVAICQEEVSERFRKRRGFDDESHREKFIASIGLGEYERTEEVPCDPRSRKSAFFRPEVLLKYKSYPEKYSFEEHSIGCRNIWTLEFYDFNEADQVHCFMRHLVRLPEDEQLHWKQFNEKPEAPISDLAESKLSGRIPSENSPLSSIKRKLHGLQLPWWKMRSHRALDRAKYPIPGPEFEEDWRKEITHLDQLIVEGFDKKWLRKRAKSLGRSPALNYGSLKLVEECLVGLEFGKDDAHSIVVPFYELHDMRSKFSHIEGEDARNLKKEALEEHRGYRRHYKNLAARCDESLEKLVEAFQDPRME